MDIRTLRCFVALDATVERSDVAPVFKRPPVGATYRVLKMRLLGEGFHVVDVSV